MAIPVAGPERDFFLELRKHFHSVVKADAVRHLICFALCQ
jgi:hypothetical protein